MSLTINVYLTMIERIRHIRFRLHVYHVLLTVVNEFRHSHLKTVGIHLFLIQQEVTVLHQVHHHSLHRTTHHLDA